MGILDTGMEVKSLQSFHISIFSLSISLSFPLLLRIYGRFRPCFPIMSIFCDNMMCESIVRP